MISTTFPETKHGEEKECACKGYGFQPGTMTSDSWGKPCECGRPQHRPKGPSECVELEEIHAKAHAKALKDKMMKALDGILKEIRRT